MIFLRNPLFLFFLLALSSCIPLWSEAQGNLLLYPKRIVFEGSKRSQVLNVSNTGKDTVKYFISIVQIRMHADGSFENIITPDPGQYFADKNIRFFPRSVVLAPNESQTVKMQVTGVSLLKPGEYRSHIYFRAERDSKPLGEDNGSKDKTDISVQLTAVFGISIPVIIRIGEQEKEINLSNASLKNSSDSGAVLNVALNRKGNVSVYGDLLVDHISPAGKITSVGKVRGMALYTPTPTRYFKLALDSRNSVDYTHGKLLIKYKTQADAGSQELAALELKLDNL